ncbi:MAG TPA: iron-sulfur cluster assembly accessory protein [Anaeromyxobacteraceae bacterium]|nr:iron-sulfur cluster assembly accessory protein [Anaeromyxobacteraceae bacterium]
MSAALQITASAAARLRSMAEERNTPGGGLRLGVQGGGCSGLSYLVDWADAPRPDDEVFERDGGRVFVDPRSARFLLGTTVEWKRSLLQSGFVFENPQAKSSCGCGQSFGI